MTLEIEGGSPHHSSPSLPFLTLRVISVTFLLGGNTTFPEHLRTEGDSSTWLGFYVTNRNNLSGLGTSGALCVVQTDPVTGHSRGQYWIGR